MPPLLVAYATRFFTPRAAQLVETLMMLPPSCSRITRAAQMTGRPRGEDVRRRVHHLRQVSSELARRFRARFVGSVRDGLTIEGGTLVLTDNYLRVRIPAGFRRNERVRVRIDRDGEPMLGSC